MAALDTWSVGIQSHFRPGTIWAVHVARSPGRETFSTLRYSIIQATSFGRVRVEKLHHERGVTFGPMKMWATLDIAQFPTIAPQPRQLWTSLSRRSFGGEACCGAAASREVLSCHLDLVIATLPEKKRKHTHTWTRVEWHRRRLSWLKPLHHGSTTGSPHGTSTRDPTARDLGTVSVTQRVERPGFIR